MELARRISFIDSYVVIWFKMYKTFVIFDYTNCIRICIRKYTSAQSYGLHQFSKGPRSIAASETLGDHIDCIKVIGGPKGVGDWLANFTFYQPQLLQTILAHFLVSGRKAVIEQSQHTCRPFCGVGIPQQYKTLDINTQETWDTTQPIWILLSNVQNPSYMLLNICACHILNVLLWLTLFTFKFILALLIHLFMLYYLGQLFRIPLHIYTKVNLENNYPWYSITRWWSLLCGVLTVRD